MTRIVRAARALALRAALFAAAACASAEAPPSAPPRTPAEIGIDMPGHFSDWLRGHYTERVLLFHGYAPMNGAGAAFVGDSITEGGDWGAAFPDLVTRNYGVSGDTTLGLERRLSQIVAARPGKIFLMIGTNDLGNENAAPEAILANYGRVLDRLMAEAPDAELFVQSLLPREPHRAEAVREINAGLQRLAAERGLAYVDLYAAFAVEGGRLDPGITEDDLHLTGPGYARWVSLIASLARAGEAP